MEQSLDKLRDKTLSFGCFIRVRDSKNNPNTSGIVKHKRYWGEEGGFTWLWDRCIGGHEGYAKTMHLSGSMIGGINRHMFKIIGHPLTRGRLCYLYYSMNSGPEDESDKIFDKISAYFFYNEKMFDQDELQWSKDEQKRPELLKLLEEFALLIPEGHNE